VGRALLFVCIVACSFRHGVQQQDGVAHDGVTYDDALPDAYRAAPSIYGTDSTNLYTLDIGARQITSVGALHDSNNQPVPNGVDSIAWVDGELIAVGWTASPQSVGTIDPATALVTFKPPLPAVHTYWGLTYDPTTRTVFAATNDTASLYRVDVASGTTSLIGPFGGGMAIYGDITWLDGVLYGTMTSGPCNPGCIATIDPGTGAATVITMTAPGALPALAAFGGALYAISGTGDVYSVNTRTGATNLLFNCGKDLGDAAP
jgi:hypothetical protein